MTNIILLIFIILGFIFAIYDQILMNKLKGETKLEIQLKKQKGTDTWLLIGLITLTIAYGIQNHIDSFSLYLLVMCIILCVYLAFLRSPRLLLKEHGFFFANIYFNYANIYQINLAEIPLKQNKAKNNVSQPETEKVLVIDLHGGRRLLVQIENKEDIAKAINFFGGYKDKSKESQ